MLHTNDLQNKEIFVEKLFSKRQPEIAEMKVAKRLITDEKFRERERIALSAVDKRTINALIAQWQTFAGATKQKACFNSKFFFALPQLKRMNGETLKGVRMILVSNRSAYRSCSESLLIRSRQCDSKSSKGSTSCNRFLTIRRSGQGFCCRTSTEQFYLNCPLEGCLSKVKETTRICSTSLINIF